MNNPLLNFARKPEVYVKLPSRGIFYDDNMITNWTINGEIAVYPMTPKDELMLLNPDSLLSGESNIQIIESCVPAIKNPRKLVYPDANVLLLAIQKATYGDDLIMNVSCPNCYEKASDLETKEEIEEAEKNGDLLIRPQENKLSIESLLESITYIDEEDTVFKTEDGLEIYFTPTLLEDKLKYGLINFNNEKLINFYKNYNFEEYATDEDKRESASKLLGVYKNINTYGNEMITNDIIKVKLPDGGYVENKEMILEYVSNCKSSIITQLHKKISYINDIGLPPKVNYSCCCCEHTWEDKLAGFNQVDFFGISSLI